MNYLQQAESCKQQPHVPHVPHVPCCMYADRRRRQLSSRIESSRPCQREPAKRLPRRSNEQEVSGQVWQAIWPTFEFHLGRLPLIYGRA